MSEEVKTEDIVEDQLQDEIVDEVNEDSLDEAAAADPKADGEKAADETDKAIDKSAPKQAAAPKTKAGMINAMYHEMSKMKKGELTAAYDKVMSMKHHDESVEIDGEAIAENNFDEDLNALVESEATLSDGFRAKAEVIFEAAVKAKVADHVNSLEEQYKEELSEETTRIHNELVEKVDGYLNYVVENWMEENKLAIESGLRNEISESFMKALHGVFNEHYIEVPESKVDLVDDMAKRNDDLEEQLNASIENNIALKEQVAELSRETVINEAAADLSEAQKEKLKSLAEGVSFDSAEDYASKVATLKESYFKTPTETPTETVELDEGVEETQVSDTMTRYLAALKK
tara:strand:+ start:2129 stop:3166 length:1038 start_codon:yes stop_codon:yes gene_type:complete